MTHHQHCKDLVETISEYVEGTLNEELCAELEKHLCDCQDCTVVVNTLRKTIELYHQASSGEEELPEGVRQRLYARLSLDNYLNPEKHTSDA